MDTTTEEVVSVTQLLGAVRYLPLVGNMTVPSHQLREPLPDGGYGAYLFCSGCGLVQPVLSAAIPDIVGKSVGPNDDLYIRVERCEFDGSDRLIGAELLPIPMDS